MELGKTSQTTGEEKLTTQNKLTPIKFYFYSIKFTPYVDVNKTSTEIIHEVMKFLSVEHQKGNGILVDRNENNQGLERPLFVTSVTFMYREKRIRGTLALLRSGKKPMLKPLDKFELIPLDKSNGQIAEVTHFFIDFSRQFPVLCLEFNSEGPRVSDLEFYCRIVARDKLRLAKGTELELFMNVPIDKALSEFKNVLSFELKVQPSKLAQLDTQLTGQYLTALTTLDQRINPKFIKLETSFQSQNRVKSSQINTGANKMIRGFLEAFKARKQNIDVFDNFVVKYEDAQGREEVFSLLKGKHELEKMIDLETIKERSMYELIEKDFDEFMQSQL